MYIKPDVIVTHPRDILYPWWMQMMNRNRYLFNKVIVVMTQYATEHNFTNYIKDTLLDATVLESYPDNGTDWRNAALTEALKHSDGERVLFLEQDFLFEYSFLGGVFDIDVNTIGFYQGDRLHPAFLLVKKEILENTRQDFSVNPDIGDHFSKLTLDLQAIGGIYDLEGTDWYHLSGLTQNYRMNENWHQPQIFFEYNKLSQELPQHNLWRNICRAKEAQMGDISPHPLISLKEFFYET